MEFRDDQYRYRKLARDQRSIVGFFFFRTASLASPRCCICPRSGKRSDDNAATAAYDRSAGIAEASATNDKFSRALYSRQVRTCIPVRLEWKLTERRWILSSYVGAEQRRRPRNTSFHVRTRIVCEIARGLPPPRGCVRLCTRVPVARKICSLYCFARLKNQVVKG